MKKCLIVTYGFFGDVFFQSSIARKLKEEKKYDWVEYVISFPQVHRMLLNNPYIDTVTLSFPPSPFPNIHEDYYKNNGYDIIRMKPFTFTEPPPIECQKWAGIENPDTEFQIYTDPTYDAIAKKTIDEMRSENGKKVIAIPVDWRDRTFMFTKEQYEKGIDSADCTGYGGKRRDVDRIKASLSEKFNIIPVGHPIDVKQQSTIGVAEDDVGSILFECSLMKACDVFIGSEGGMCNMASGVGTRTIITGDFVHQLYGWNGSCRKIKEPKLGPVHYFKDKGHVALDPFLSDDEVIDEIKKSLL
jgi:hypothetical protein